MSAIQEQIPAAGANLAASDAYCAKLSREKARNFYYGMKLTPQPKRAAMFALYAWMRRADDLADEAGELAAKEMALRQFLTQTDAVIDGDDSAGGALGDDLLWPAVKRMAILHHIPRRHLHDMIAGQMLDQRKTRYATFEELYDYCYKVASVVGLCCVEIWGYDADQAEEVREMAEWRGIAFQLTNILRDVVEDAQRDRVYLPAEFFGVRELTPKMILEGDRARLMEGIKNVAAIAEDHYRRSGPLDRLIHRDGRACLWAMTGIYRGLLHKMLPDLGVIFRQRVRLSGWRKAWIALRATLSK